MLVISGYRGKLVQYAFTSSDIDLKGFKGYDVLYWTRDIYCKQSFDGLWFKCSCGIIRYITNINDVLKCHYCKKTADKLIKY
jgi:hypothetical protein